MAVLGAGGGAPAAFADSACPPGRLGPTVGVTGTYSGTWTYKYDQPQPYGLPDIVQSESLSWSESLNGNTSGCWKLGSLSGSASRSGSGSSGGSAGDCSATLSQSANAATNFEFDQTNSAGTAPDLILQNPQTGVTDKQNWYLEEYVPNQYGNPEGVVQSSDGNPQEWCSTPNAGDQPTNNTMFGGGGCHITTFYQGGPVDFVSAPTRGGGSGSDSCQYTTQDSQGNTTTETLNQSLTLTSEVPTCSDISASTKAGKPITVQMACSISISAPLGYAVTTQPVHGRVTYDSATGRLQYLPIRGFKGTDTFEYDGQVQNGLASSPATVTVKVTKAKKKKHKHHKKKKHKHHKKKKHKHHKHRKVKKKHTKKKHRKHHRKR